MNHRQDALILRELESCQSILKVLTIMLDNSTLVADFRPLAVMAADGSHKLDTILDMVTSG